MLLNLFEISYYFLIFSGRREDQSARRCGCPVDTSAKQKQRPSRQTRRSNFEPGPGSKYKKRHPYGCLFLYHQSARRGSNPRPPPWQGGAPPLSHSRISSQHIKIYHKENYLSTTFLLFSKIINLVEVYFPMWDIPYGQHLYHHSKPVLCSLHSLRYNKNCDLMDLH